jgi:hypothetical protein
VISVSLVDHARHRLSAALEEIDRLKQSEFPYSHSREALGVVESLLRKQRYNLDQLLPTAPTELVQTECMLSLDRLFLYLPILGFILRSTNTRNAFEICGPLLRLSRQVLGPATKLIVSSEWEYSPFTFSPMAALPNFVLIGLPASESSNPLLLPLAGHELGHRLWTIEGLDQRLQRAIEEKVVAEITSNRWSEYERLHPSLSPSDLATDMFAHSTWEPAYTWAILQCEEIFCDILAVRVFQESFLHAFEYLCSPRTPGQRALNYPNLKKRVTHMMAAAGAFAVQVPDGFIKAFVDLDEPVGMDARLLVGVADVVSDSLVSELIGTVGRLAEERAIPTRDRDAVDHIASMFRRVVPTQDGYPLTDILNAAWCCHNDKALWADVPQIPEQERMEILREIVLKSIEVAEIQHRLSVTA